MKVLFAGTPDFAVPALKQLIDSPNHQVVAVLTNPDAPGGRGKKLRLSPVKNCALEHDLPVLQPLKLNAEARMAVESFSPDIMVVVAYGKIFGPKFLALFPEGGVNLHPSLLPLHRGPAPIPAAILSGEAVSGITVQQVGLKMDAGDIILQEEFAIEQDANTRDISEYCSNRGAQMLETALDNIAAGTAHPRAQDESKATYCSLLNKEDGRIDWSLPAVDIHRLVRAYLPWPLAHSNWGERSLNIQSCLLVDADSLQENFKQQMTDAVPGQVIGIDKSLGILVQTGDGILALTQLQLQSKRAMDWKSFINGNPLFTTSILGRGPAEQ